ncbi:transposase-like protein, partial [Macrophomina phaseolina MS6]
MAVLISKVVRSSSAERVDEWYSSGNNTANRTHLTNRTAVPPATIPLEDDVFRGSAGMDTNIEGKKSDEPIWSTNYGDRDKRDGIVKTVTTVVRHESCEVRDECSITQERQMVMMGDKLSFAIDAYCIHRSKETAKQGEYHIHGDMLFDEDWDEVQQHKDVLAPFKEATKHLEGGGEDGSFGSVWEALVCLEMMLGTLGRKKEELGTHLTSYVKACVTLAWRKVYDYYNRSDSTPAYHIAVALHPCLRFQYFKKHWKEFKIWQDDAIDAFKDA